MITHFLAASILVAASLPVTPVNSDILNKYIWKRRIVLIFGDTMNQSVANQADDLQTASADAESRDLTVLTVVGGIVSDSGQDGGLPPADALRRRFRIDDQAPFTVILVGKDGREKLRDSNPVASTKLFALIDSMPMRQREAREE